MTTLAAQFGPVLEAASFAARAHQGQFRKDNRTPYIGHPFRVCLVVRDIFGFDDPKMLQAALLHDTVEDTTTDFDEVSETFGEEVARWVALLTKDKRLPDEDREQEYCQHLASAPWQVKACKLADIFDNLLDGIHLSAETRARSRDRAKKYLAALEKDPEKELKKPLDLVRKLLEEATK